MSKKFFLSLVSFSVVGFFACQQEITNTDVTNVADTAPNAAELSKQYSYSGVNVPKGFERFAALLKVENPTTASLTFDKLLKEGDGVKIIGVTDAEAKLGRVLFYDKKLSINNTIACGSCHHQDKGFSDGKALSPGFQGALTTRNSMSIVNPGMIRAGMFWDRRETTVRDMSLNPVRNHIEMGMVDLDLLETKLAGSDYYAQLFTDAYGSPAITSANISDAITSFLRSMVSWNSKYDQGVKNNFGNFTAEEKRGMEIFMGKNQATSGGFGSSITGACNTCHSAPMFNDGNTVNAYYDVDFLANLTGGGIDIGLDMQSKDRGAKNSGGFKIPSLRNVELTGPYMHDGRFKTLEEVVGHYNDGVKNSPSLSARLKDPNTGKPLKLNLSDSDKKAIVAFMKTLTDDEFIHNPKYSNPFKN
jgi:cytochrome c peroxidase